MTALQCSLKSLKQNMTDSLSEWQGHLLSCPGQLKKTNHSLRCYEMGREEIVGIFGDEAPFMGVINWFYNAWIRLAVFRQPLLQDGYCRCWTQDSLIWSSISIGAPLAMEKFSFCTFLGFTLPLEKICSNWSFGCPIDNPNGKIGILVHLIWLKTLPRRTGVEGKCCKFENFRLLSSSPLLGGIWPNIEHWNNIGGRKGNI